MLVSKGTLHKAAREPTGTRTAFVICKILVGLKSSHQSKPNSCFFLLFLRYFLKIQSPKEAILMTRLRIRRPDDFHRHLRQPPLLPSLARHIGPFGRILPMPNTTPPKLTGPEAVAYSEEIMDAAPGVTAVPCIKIVRSTTSEIIHTARALGVLAAKFYPEGMTTNAEDGLRAEKLRQRKDILEAMQETGMLLLCHGEHDKSGFCLDRERDFLKVAGWVLDNFPRLKVVLEHITTAHAVTFVERRRLKTANLSATITPHHLRISLNEVVGDKLMPHNFCKPLAKRPEDRAALIRAATSGNPAFFLGTDDAPHLRHAKECPSGCAGVFTGPFALGHYAQVFEEAGALDRIENFASCFGAQFYNLPLNEGTVELVRQPFTLPTELDGVVPFMAGQTLNWQAV